MLLGAFARDSQSTVFVLVVTLAQAWQEHAEAQWPEATAQVKNCVVDQSSSDRRNRFYIDCQLSYRVGDESAEARIYSLGVIAAEYVIWQSRGALGVGDLQAWVDVHPAGSPIAIRYDPSKHSRVVPMAGEIPLTGPHTPNNLKLLGVTAAICVVLLGVGRTGQ